MLPGSWTLLLVEDDPVLGDGLRDFLESEGFQVVWARSVLQARGEGIDGKDLAVVDWMLPDGSGLDVLKAFKEADPLFPVIFLTVRQRVEDKVQALDLGADDYVVKPFEPRELLARIFALLRRTYTPHTRFHLDDVEVDLSDGTVRTPWERYTLPQKERLLLRELWKRRNRVVRYAHLERVLWGEETPGNRASLQVFVSHLRKILGRDRIENVRHLGYRLKA